MTVPNRRTLTLSTASHALLRPSNEAGLLKLDYLYMYASSVLLTPHESRFGRACLSQLTVLEEAGS
jgi:hypothetical protein